MADVGALFWDLLVNKILVVLAFAYPIAAGFFFHRLRLEQDREVEARKKAALAAHGLIGLTDEPATAI